MGTDPAGTVATDPAGTTGTDPAGTTGTDPAGTTGTDPAGLAALLLGTVTEFVAGLDGERVSDLLAGRARLAVVPVTRTEPVTAGERARETRQKTRQTRQARATGAGPHRGRAEPPSGPALEALNRSLREAPSREAAERILDDLGPLTVAALRELAKGLGVTGVLGRDTRPAVLRKIVDGTVGRRLRSAAIFGGGL